jgi:hypothetical protein
LRLWRQENLGPFPSNTEVIIMRFSHFESQPFVVVRGVMVLKHRGAPFSC